ncbi:MAG: MFS transporter [Desulfarculaceae bacterium]|nr:MFS transporter [Desulfarculaceae bacterium]MCF8047730.1 MFS transporter [Desulfarculaceae bacterium]MCF8065475.1 MFS transporter [Desulfarculaceae bacterium]MCF8096311.1 MFS transporter [Desulfarculaceae bacterium]MCF8123528.1 MFS transporter [Desulfarculaceae bacterium]
MPPTASADLGPLAALEPKRRWWCLALVAATAFMVGLDFLAVSLALPRMALHFGVGITLASKVTAVYLLVGVCLFPVGKGLVRRMGHKRLLLWGVGLFWVGSLLCGLSPGMGELVAARAVQGLGAALMGAAGLALVGPDRGLGLAALAGALGAMAGAVLGALVAGHLGWRPVFWLSLPLGAAVVLAGLKLLPASPPANRESSLDLVGALLLMGGLYFVISALDLGKAHGPADLRPWLSLALGVGCLATLLPWERRAPEPIVLLTALRERGLAWGLASLFCWAALTGAALFLLPFYLIDLLGLTTLTAGLLLALVPATALLLGRALGWLTEAWGSGHLALSLGLGALAGVVGVEQAFSLSLPGSLVRGGVHFTQAGLPLDALEAAFGHAFILIPALALAAAACARLSRRVRR